MTTLPSNRPSAGLIIHLERQDSIGTQIESLHVALRGVRDPITGAAQVSLLMWHLVAAVLMVKGLLDEDAITTIPALSPLRVGNTVIHVTHCPE